MTTPTDPAARNPWGTRLETSFVVIVVLGALPLIAHRLTGGFLVTPEYHSLMFVPAQVFGLLTALLGFRYIRTGITRAARLPPTPGQRRLRPDSPLASGVTVVFVCIGYFLGATAINPGLAMLSALVSSAPQKIEVQAADPSASGRRRCPVPIAVASQPIGFGRVCNQSSALHSSLRAGDRITASGDGSAWGLFVDTMQKLD